MEYTQEQVMDDGLVVLSEVGAESCDEDAPSSAPFEPDDSMDLEGSIPELDDSTEIKLEFSSDENDSEEDEDMVKVEIESEEEMDYEEGFLITDEKSRQLAIRACNYSLSPHLTQYPFSHSLPLHYRQLLLLPEEVLQQDAPCGQHPSHHDV